MPAATARQTAGFLLSPNWITDPELARPFVKDMADHGYLAAILFVRHMDRDLWDDDVHDCVKAIAGMCRDCDIQFVLDTDHCWWGARWIGNHAHAAVFAYGSSTAEAMDGVFEFQAPLPPCQGIKVIRDLAAVYRVTPAGYERVDMSTVTWDWQNYGEPHPGVLVRGRLAAGGDGPLVAYVRFHLYDFPDVAHPDYLAAQHDLLDRYADVPIDGFGWDEPGKGLGNLAYFKSGPGFEQLFEELHGYALADELIRLDHLDDDPITATFRCQYYGALNEMNRRAQAAHNAHARELFGDHILLGTHQTWSGLPTDLVAGCIDYFRLGSVLTAAWTDGSWWCELKYQAFEYLLADGIRLELGLRDAYYNDWTKQVPAVEDMHFANRFKKLFHVNWFNIFFSHFTENEVNFRLDPLRAQAIADLADLDDFDTLLDGACKAVSPVAWLYLWEGLAAAPKWLTRVHYSASANAALHLADCGLFATMMSPVSLARADLADGCLRLDGREYRVLFVPLANAMPRAVWDRLLEAAAAGVQVVVMGPPPQFTADTREDIGGEFAEALGIEPLTFARWQQVSARNHGVPALDQWEPEWFDVICPLRPTTATVRRDGEDRIIVASAADRALHYLPLADPREDLVNLLLDLVDPPVDAFAPNTYVRRFVDPADPRREVILLAANGHVADEPLVPDRYAPHARPPRKHRELRALLRLPGGELEARGGTWCAIRLLDHQPDAILGDCPHLTYAGQRLG